MCKPGEVYPGVSVDAFHGIPADGILRVGKYRIGVDLTPERICKRCCHRHYEPPRVCAQCPTGPLYHCGPGCENCMGPCAECDQMVCGIHSSIVPDGRLCDVCRGGL